jgi:hypothetical protein
MGPWSVETQVTGVIGWLSIIPDYQVQNGREAPE